MPSKTENVKMGVCRVTFDGVDLGYTKGGVDVTVTTETKQIMVDQFGNAPIDEIITGRSVKAKLPLAETTLENMVRIMPGAVLVNTGGVKASGNVTLLTAVPVEGDTVTINGVVFTFSDDPVGVNDVEIGATFALSAANLADRINASIDPLVSQITATVLAGVVTITADDAGVAGNAVTLAKAFTTEADATVSGANLTAGADSVKKKVVVPNGVGQSLLQIAKKLVIHPIANAETNRDEDFTIPLAMTPGAMQFSYKLDQERIFDCEFVGYPDSTTRTLFIVGDETAA
jgi:hypothetical protein